MTEGASLRSVDSAEDHFKSNIYTWATRAGIFELKMLFRDYRPRSTIQTEC